jgi:hypothetical protein
MSYHPIVSFAHKPLRGIENAPLAESSFILMFRVTLFSTAAPLPFSSLSSASSVDESSPTLLHCKTLAIFYLSLHSF